MKVKRAILAIMIIGMAFNTGCNVSFMNDIHSYPLVPELTTAELRDYYAKSLEFDSIITKNLDVYRTDYELLDVDDESKINELEDAVNKTIGLLNQMEYVDTQDNRNIVSEETFNYIKAYLNDRKLTNGDIVSIKQALGHYFVDVQFKISSRSVGTFNTAASLLGIHGAFYHDNYSDIDKLDTTYLQSVIGKLNSYYIENNMDGYSASFDPLTGTFEFTNGDNGTLSNNTGTTSSTTESTDTTSSGTENTDATNGDTESTDTTSSSVDNTQVNVNSVLTTREQLLDIDLINNVAGSSTTQTAYMPQLNLVFNIPASEGDIGGIGIYPVGEQGLSKFGFNREQLDGTETLRFVYKQDVNKPDLLINTNIYSVFSEITTGFASNNDSIVPEFLMTEFEKILDRADRAIMNCDITALMSGDIFTDTSIGILRGYEDQYTNVLRQLSTIRRIVSRDVENSSYLVEVETQRQEGPKDGGVYGTYRDRSYVTIEQIGQEFVITDWLRLVRELQTEPDINPDSAVAKRLVATLDGVPSEEAKEAAKQLLQELYRADTYRVLRGPKEIPFNNATIIVEKGMYDCFNDDTEMLSADKLEELNSRIRSLLVKHGTNVSATHTGVITEWIGGSNNQIEFTTEEIITYNGMDDGVYLKCYYLLSNMSDKWVIDDIQIIEQEDVSGSELASLVDRISE